MMLLAFLAVSAIVLTDGFVQVTKRESKLLVNPLRRSNIGPIYSSISTDQVEESWSDTATLIGDLFQLSATPLSVVQLCDRIDASKLGSRESILLSLSRQALLSTMLRSDRNQYLETVKFLGARIPRKDLPNLQDVPYFNYEAFPAANSLAAEDQIIDLNDLLIKDCALPNVTFAESPLDIFLLGIFRNLVQKEVLYKSEIPGIKGLLQEGKHYYLSDLGSVTENQHAFVRRTLGALLTPFLPPFYRIFMAGIIPSEQRGDPKWLADGTIYALDAIKNVSFIGENKWAQENLVPGTQFGPLFYAPFLTSVVTPPFLNFLVGPSKTNRRKDGALGGIVVEKCKFLQESGCKGLCLHQCKLPAQQFFKESLGLSLTVIPDFNTQACQWSWGEEPLAPELDPAFPKGCLSNCPTRSELKEIETAGNKPTICNA